MNRSHQQKSRQFFTLFCSVALLGSLIAVETRAVAQTIVRQPGMTDAQVKQAEADLARRQLLNANITTLDGLTKRKAEQLDQIQKVKAFHNFQFTDKLKESGITFHHNTVDDCTRSLIAIQYDHGSGVAAADVDGDGLTDIYFVNQIGGCELWRNLGNGKFENITAKAGVGLADKVCVGVTFADYDNDGRPDLFVTTVKMGNVLFHNEGGGKFKDVTQEAGVGAIAHSSGAFFFDFNNDGLLDLFVSNVGVYTTDKKGPGGYWIGVSDVGMGWDNPARRETCILYKNLGNGKFKDVSQEMNIQVPGWSGDGLFGDINGDGFMDLYIMNMQGKNHLLENQGGSNFVDKTDFYLGKTPFGTMGGKFFDFNQDGKMDLYITDMHSDMTSVHTKEGKRNYTLKFDKEKSDIWCSKEWGTPHFEAITNAIFGNAFYMGNNGGKLSEVSDKINAETYWPWGITVADFNADGYEDVFVTSGMGYPFRYSINNLLLNDAGERFADAEFATGIEPRAGNRIEIPDYFTLDTDGADKNHPLSYNRHGKFAVPGSASSRSSVAFDIDGDGDLDLVTAEFNDHPQVLVSNLSERKKVEYIKIKLVGTKSNRDGLGAKVQVTTGGKTFTQVYDGKSGYVSQSSLPLYFGLGDKTSIDRIEVTWPSGKKQTIAQVPQINTQISITEPN